MASSRISGLTAPPSAILLTITVFARCSPTRLGPLARWRSGGAFRSVLRSRTSSMSARSTRHFSAGPAGGWRSSRV